MLRERLDCSQKHTIKWYRDNQSVSRIVKLASMKEHLQCRPLHIFSVCLLYIKLEVEWIPRSTNDRADILSKVIDYNDWQIKRDNFLMADREAKWGPHSVDWFVLEWRVSMHLCPLL